MSLLRELQINCLDHYLAVTIAFYLSGFCGNFLCHFQCEKPKLCCETFIIPGEPAHAPKKLMGQYKGPATRPKGLSPVAVLLPAALAETWHSSGPWRCKFNCFLNFYHAFFFLFFCHSPMIAFKQESVGTRPENNLNKRYWAVIRMILLY